jgi:hypothetical protein
MTKLPGSVPLLSVDCDAIITLLEKFFEHAGGKMVSYLAVPYNGKYLFKSSETAFVPGGGRSIAQSQPGSAPI